MRRSDLLKLMGLTAGGAAGAPLANKWYVHHGWTDAARAASLAVRQAKAAARAAAAGSSGESSSGSSTSSSESTSGGGGDPDSSSSQVRVSGFTVNGRGKVSVGFTDYSVDPPVNRYLTEGGEDGGWTIKSADYDAGTAVLVKDGQEITVSMGSGGGTARDGSGQLAEEQAADHAEWQDGQGGAGSPIEDYANAGIDAFHDKYGRQPVSEDDCKEAAGLSDATTDSDLEAVEEWIRERAADDADAAQTDAPGGNSQAGLPEGVTLGGASGTEEVAGGKTRSDWFDLAQAAFKAKYGREPVEDSEVAEAETLAHVPAVFRSDAPEAGAGAASGVAPSDTAPGDEAIHARALEMVRGEGPDAEPPSFDDLTAVFNADLESSKTPEDRLAALNEYRASLEAGQLMWENTAASAFEALNGKRPESDSDWRIAVKLAGVPKPFLKAGTGQVGATANRRSLRLARLSNRVDTAAGCLLANVGWTDEARAASLAVRRGGSSAVKRDPLSDARDLLAAFPGSIGNRPSPDTFEAARKEFAYTYCRDPRTPQEWAQAFYSLYQFQHANRLYRSGGSMLANIGWTDAAREAALLVRRAKADARSADGTPSRIWVAGTPGQDGPPIFGGGSIRAPDAPGEGTVINVGGWISVMMNGKPVRIGSTKVLCVLPDGQLGVKLGGKAYPIGDPAKWRTGSGRPPFMMIGGKYMLDVGKGYLDLSTGQVKVKPGQDGVKVGGKVMRVLERYSPFMGGGVDIPPDPPDESQRRYLRA